jgi:hypothetical protein
MERFINWCLVSHGHDMAQADTGLWIRYSDYEKERHELAALLIESASEICHAYGGFAGLPEDHPAVVLLHKIGKALKGHTNG